MAFPEIFWSRTDFEELEIQEFSNSMNHVLEFHADLQTDQIATKKYGRVEKKIQVQKSNDNYKTNFYYEKIHMS